MCKALGFERLVLVYVVLVLHLFALLQWPTALFLIQVYLLWNLKQTSSVLGKGFAAAFNAAVLMTRAGTTGRIGWLFQRMACCYFYDGELLVKYWTCLELSAVICQVFRSKLFHAGALIYSNVCDKVELIILLRMCTVLTIYCLSNPVLNSMNWIE